MCCRWRLPGRPDGRSEEHTSELQSRSDLVCRLLLEKKKKQEPAARRLLPENESLLRADQQSLHGLRRGGGQVPGGPALRGCDLFFNDTATTENYTLSLHDALPI